MDKKTQGVLLGVAGVILWFMPLVYVDMGNFMGGKYKDVVMYQTGQSVGGIAYLLLISFSFYAYSSWVINRQFAIIASSVSLGISVLFLLQAGLSVAWGLLIMVVVSVYSLILAKGMVEGSKLSE